LESFFAEALPYIFGHCLVITGGPQSLEAKQKIVAALIRLANEIASYCTTSQERRLLIPREAQAEIEMLSAFDARTPIERVDQITLGLVVQALGQQLRTE
jgi:hypothetical protein